MDKMDLAARVRTFTRYQRLAFLLGFAGVGASTLFRLPDPLGYSIAAFTIGVVMGLERKAAGVRFVMEFYD